MKEKFTKGEWKINQYFNSSRFEVVFNESMECVAECVHDLPDAHLIAASKKLYYKLYEMELFMEQMHEADPDWTIKESQLHHKEIRDLLARARGEDV